MLPADRDVWYLGEQSRQFRVMDARALARIFASLSNAKQRSQFYVLKVGPGFAVSQHSLEMNLGMSASSGAADRLHIAAPVDYPDLDGPEAAVNAFQDWVEKLPVQHATAGYGFDLSWGREWEMVAMPQIMAAGRRFLAIEVRNRLTEIKLLNKLLSPAWLTYLRSDMIKMLGGDTRFGGKFDSDVKVIQCRDGVILRAGEKPPIGDTNRRATDLGPLKQVYRVVKPLCLNEWFATQLFRIEASDANAWFARLEQ
jgi:hypothetical protein